MISPCEILQLDIPDVDRNHIPSFFLVSVREIISVQEIYSDSLFIFYNVQISTNEMVEEEIQISKEDDKKGSKVIHNYLGKYYFHNIVSDTFIHSTLYSYNSHTLRKL